MFGKNLAPLRRLAVLSFFIFVVFSLTGCFTVLGSRGVTEETQISATEVEERAELTSNLVYHGLYATDAIQLEFEREMSCAQRESTTVETIQTRENPRRNLYRDLLFPGAVAALTLGLVLRFRLGVHDSTAPPWDANPPQGYDPLYTQVDDAGGGVAGGVIALGLMAGWLVSGIYGAVAGIIYKTYPRTSVLDAQIQQSTWQPVDCANKPVADAPARILLGDTLLFDGTTSENGALRFGIQETRDALERAEFADTPYFQVVLQGQMHEFREHIELPDELLDRLNIH